MLGCVVHKLEAVDSTQAALARLAREGAPEGTVVTAGHQTGGRGSRGRHWWDAPGESLLLSVLLRPAIPTAHAPQLSLVAGLAVTDSLAALNVRGRIRWPNDVLVGGRKICGVLPEAVSRGDGRVEHVILGIGVNVNQTEFPQHLRDHAISLRLATGAAHDPERLLGRLLDALDGRYEAWRVGGFAALRDAWRLGSCTIGEPVRTADGRDGVAVDVAEDGALLVRTRDGGLRRVVSRAGIGARGLEAEGDRDAARH